MSSLGWLVRKEFARFRSDRSGAVLTVVSPVALSVLLSVIVSATLTERAVGVLVVDEAQDARSRALVTRLAADPLLSVEVVGAQEARARVDRGEAAAALVLPPDTAQGLEVGALWRPPLEVALWYDPAQTLSLRQVRGAVQGQWMRALLEDPTLRVGARGEPSLPLRLVEVPANAQGEFNAYAHCFAGMLCMFLLLMGQDMACHTLGERHSGTLARVRLARVAGWEALGAVAVSTALIALLISALVYGVGMVAFGVRVEGSWVGFGAVLVGQAWFVGGVALALSALARTERQLVSVGTLSILLMSFVGGAWMPSFLMPGWAQATAKALPLHWAMEGLAAMTWRGLGAWEGLKWAARLGAFGCALGALGVWRFRWR
jgi:ABC-2 type transport system permease protein